MQYDGGILHCGGREKNADDSVYLIDDCVHFCVKRYGTSIWTAFGVDFFLLTDLRMIRYAE